MKTDRRHALQTNWLADHLGRWLDKIKPYTNHIITGVFVVAAGLAIWLVVAHFWRGDEDAVWQQLSNQASRANRLVSQETKEIIRDVKKKQTELNNLSPPLGNDEQAQQAHRLKVQSLNNQIDELEKQFKNKQTEILEREQESLCRIAKDNIRTVAGRAAAFSAASKDFSEAMGSLLVDPIGARTKLDRAAELLELVRDNAKDKLLKQRAQFQLARVYETRLRQDDPHSEKDDIQLARHQYEDLVNQVPPSYCKAEAERRLAALNPKTAGSTAPKDPVYVWLSDEMEKRRSSPLPPGPGSSGLLGDRPPPELE
jgi:hypothetical protein